MEYNIGLNFLVQKGEDVEKEIATFILSKEIS